MTASIIVKKSVSKATPKVKAPKAEPVISLGISTAYAELIATGLKNENSKTNFNADAIQFVIWLDAQPENQVDKKATLTALGQDLTFTMPVRAGHVQATGTAVLLFNAYGLDHKVGDILTLATRLNTAVGVGLAGAEIALHATIESLKAATATTAESQEANEKDTKKATPDSFFKGALKEARKLGKAETVKVSDTGTLKTLIALLIQIEKAQQA